MKKIYIISTVIVLFLVSCTGDKGAIGPQGDPGPTGASGTNGVMGPKGLTGAKGDTGATGATGIQGPQGITPSLPVSAASWTSLTGWQQESDYNNSYSFKDSVNISEASLLPTNSLFSAYLVNDAGYFLVTDKTTKEPLGSLYVYFKITQNAVDTVFPLAYNGFPISFQSNLISNFSDYSFKTVSGYNSIRFDKTTYPTNTDFQKLIKDTNPSIRFIYFPYSLTGLVKNTDMKNYEKVIQTFGIHDKINGKVY